jgi:hypothetical protein
VESAPADEGALRALVRQGEILARSGNVREARAAYTRAQAHPACQGTWSGLVEKALRALGG